MDNLKIGLTYNTWISKTLSISYFLYIFYLYIITQVEYEKSTF
jgi:hypothetical protein